jgi:hypothetical protein
MADAQCYYIVSNDPDDKVIYGGPLLWDGVTPYDPGSGYELIFVEIALAAGYAFPPPPPPAVNAAVMQDRAAAALTANAAYLAIPAPDADQVAAQVQQLTLECSGVIQLLLGLTGQEFLDLYYRPDLTGDPTVGGS